MGFIKGQVSGIRYETIDQLKHAIIAAFASVSRNSFQKMAQRTWRRMELCKNNEGQHTDPLDQGSATPGTRATGGTRKDFLWHAK